MKYRTVIEVICEASDKDEAGDIAGEFLKGNVDFGVDMKCRVMSLWRHRTVRYALASAFALLMLIPMAVKVTSTETVSTQDHYKKGYMNTFTIMPELRTQYAEQFKNDWQEKKEEAVLDLIRN